MASPFYVVLYIFLGVIALLCILSWLMYVQDICSGLCNYKPSYDAADVIGIELEEHQPLTSLRIDDVDSGQKSFEHAHEHDRSTPVNSSENNVTTGKNVDASNHVDSVKLEMVVVHSQPPSQRNSVIEPSSSFTSPKNSATESSSSAIPPKRNSVMDSHLTSTKRDSMNSTPSNRDSVVDCMPSKRDSIMEFSPITPDNELTTGKDSSSTTPCKRNPSMKRKAPPPPTSKPPAPPTEDDMKL